METNNAKIPDFCIPDNGYQYFSYCRLRIHNSGYKKQFIQTISYPYRTISL